MKEIIEPKDQIYPINIQTDISKFESLYPDDKFIFSISFTDQETENLYSQFFNLNENKI
jgi:hypothetical protein